MSLPHGAMDYWPPEENDLKSVIEQRNRYLIERDEAVVKLAEAKRLAEIGQAVEDAARDLPYGWIVNVHVENGAAWVDLEPPQGLFEDFHSDDGLAAEVREAVEYAKNKHATP